MIIDCHMHIDGYSQYHVSPSEVAVMERDAGVDKAVVFSIWLPSSKSNNITLEAYQKYPELFIPFGHVRPNDIEAMEEIERIGKKLEWKGLKLHFGEFSKDDKEKKEELNKIIEKGSEAGIFLYLIDCGGKIEIMDEVTKNFPNVSIIIAHLGSNIQLLDRFCLLAKRDNVYLDTSFLHIYRKIKDAVEMASAEKIVWGSDGFLMHPVVELAKVKCLKLPKEDEAMILGENMAKLLGM